MKLNLRQGIIRQLYRGRRDYTPNPYVVKNNTVYIDANRDDSLLVSFCYKNKDYLFVEDEKIRAWDNLPKSTCWLYWDINPTTGKRTFGYTLQKPLHGNKFPKVKPKDQHFFDHRDKIQKVWNGTVWKEVLRVFAGKRVGDLIIPEGFNKSQTGIHEKVNAGFLLFDEYNNPLKQGDFFITTEDIVDSVDNLFTQEKIEGDIISGRCNKPLGRYHCITWSERGKFYTPTSSDDIDPNNKCAGILVEPVAKNNQAKFITNGIIKDKIGFRWTQKPNTILFVGKSGEITTKPPQTGSLQRVGYIIDAHTIYVNLDDKILLRSPIENAPEPPPLQLISDFCTTIECVIPEFCTTVECTVPEFCTTIECTVPEFCTTIECVVPEFCTTIECTVPEFCTTISCEVPEYCSPISCPVVEAFSLTATADPEFPIFTNRVELHADYKVTKGDEPTEVTYRWEQISGDPVTLNSTTAKDTFFEFSTESDRRFRVVANEGKSYEAETSVPVYSQISNFTRFSINSATPIKEAPINGDISHRILMFTESDSNTFNNDDSIAFLDVSVNNDSLSNVVGKTLEKWDPTLREWAFAENGDLRNRIDRYTIDKSTSYRIVTHWTNTVNRGTYVTYSEPIQYDLQLHNKVIGTSKNTTFSISDADSAVYAIERIRRYRTRLDDPTALGQSKYSIETADSYKSYNIERQAGVKPVVKELTPVQDTTTKYSISTSSTFKSYNIERFSGINISV